MKYTREVLEEAVRSCSNFAEVMRHLGLRPNGGHHTHLSRRIKALGIDTSHFTGQAHQKGRPARNRLHWSEVLTLAPAGANRKEGKILRRALLEYGRPHKCEKCGTGPEWFGSPLVLHVDHIDGHPHDSRPENVRFLCPNCHSQTPTWAGRRRGVDPLVQAPLSSSLRPRTKAR
ncbi:HNH endonuclease [Rhodococcus pyridinivorans]|uniref:HNH endonuclease signature motif containing protein n=1 Tax=Rhodococcus TaxID=1827 RepID=UPI00051A2F32|nr:MULTISPECIES: HNH endonuclease signature motif containing protein [Rhodococcus]KHJ70535.1 HNH endonuclease [Rhodococcus sp. Chr-9]UPK66344.1 HNH endonuclease [Rhodococcus pyridinivorans]UVT26093.1 HNH endonuclease [Rhodococcus pyridinivorans]